MDRFPSCDCNGCKSPYIQKIDNILWFEIPKNGSSSIKQALNQKGKKWVGVKDISEIKLNETKSYSIIRNPYDRFLSAYHQFVTDKRLFQSKLIEMELEESIENIIDNMHEWGSQERIHHFYPQSHFIKAFHPHIELIPIEEIDKFFKVLGVESNKSNAFPKRPTREELSEEEREKIYNLYKEDFDYLNFPH